MPTNTKRTSPSASSSSRTSANGSRRLPAASSSDTPCFFRFAAALSGSNSTCMAYHTYLICMPQIPRPASCVVHVLLIAASSEASELPADHVPFEAALERRPPPEPEETGVGGLLLVRHHELR